MKRIIITITTILAAVAMNAQQVDIKQFHKAGPDAVYSLLGNPAGEKWTTYEDEGVMCLGSQTKDGYGPSGVIITLLKDSYALESFKTENPKYLFLTDYVQGGVKAGDQLSKIQNVDFVHTRYGRNKAENGLKFVRTTETGKSVYSIFAKEQQSFILYVKNGKILSILYESKPELPDNYDTSNLLFK